MLELCHKVLPQSITVRIPCVVKYIPVRIPYMFKYTCQNPLACPLSPSPHVDSCIKPFHKALAWVGSPSPFMPKISESWYRKFPVQNLCKRGCKLCNYLHALPISFSFPSIKGNALCVGYTVIDLNFCLYHDTFMANDGPWRGDTVYFIVLVSAHPPLWTVIMAQIETCHNIVLFVWSKHSDKVLIVTRYAPVKVNPGPTPPPSPPPPWHMTAVCLTIQGTLTTALFQTSFRHYKW